MTQELKKITTDKFEVTLLENNIIENYVRSEVVIEAEDMIELKKLNAKIMDNKPYALLVTAGEMVSISKEARELSASKEFIENSLAKAIIIKSIADKILSNFYVQVNKPYLPTKLFSDRQKALEWLKSFVK